MLFKKENLKKLQEYLKKNNLKAYLIFTSDPHDNEYIAEFYLSLRKFFAPFSGSAAELLITQNEAYLFTDGRYWLQAEKELKGSDVYLIKKGDKNVPSLKEFILKNNLFPLGSNLYTFKMSEYEDFIASNIKIVDLDISFLINNLTPLSKEKVFKLDESLFTFSYKEKIEKIYQKLNEKNAKATLITTLDDIAYILNLRGRDIPFNPVFYSYLYLSKDYGNHLFIDKEKINFEIEGINIHPYENIEEFIKKHNDIPTLLDKGRVNAKIYQLFNNVIDGINPSYLMKAVKNEKEILNTKEIQALDGVALLKFNKFLDENISNNLTEYQYSEKLKEYRFENQRCFDLSFNTIAAVGKNAAEMHYAPKKDSSSVVNSENIELLVDSGGQYYGGTTDTTRTFLIGKPSEEFIHDYTLTLKSLINLSKTIFLEGSSGQTIDIRSREFMWEEGKDYKCGTGHGVGYILNVHEGPNGFRYKKVKERDDQSEIIPGMITTIEPGVYKENKYGIRIENNLLCVKAFETSDGLFYKFETITYVPIETRCLDYSILDKKEIEWINDYHKLVFEKLYPLIKDDEKLVKYLKEKTKEI